MFNKELSLQEYFYLGYLYLIILGLLSDAIFYAILGVPYLNYTTILDALMSPLNVLSNWFIALSLICIFVAMYFYTTKLAPVIYKKLRVKKWYQKVYNIEKWDKKYTSLEDKKNLIILMFFMFFVMFICLRIGMGFGIKSKIQLNEFKPNYLLTFKDNSELEVKKIGQNSTYFFYVTAGEKQIAITPILENLKKIKKITR